MSFLGKISVAGAFLGASMMLASSAGAVSVGGDFTDDGGNTTAEGGITNIAGGQLLQADSELIGSSGPDGFKFVFNNTAAQDVFIVASINDNPDLAWDNFVATLFEADGVTIIDQFSDLPAPTSGSLFGGIVGQGLDFILTLTWNGFDAGQNPIPSNLDIKVFSSFDLNVGEVPIPPSLVLFGSGLLGLGFLSARRRRKATSV